MSYGYNSKTVFINAVTDIEDEAAVLLDRLAGNRQSPSERLWPIIFVSQPWGG